MKFWKLGLLTTSIFSAFITILLYASCERNVCDNVTCFNGGSCNTGVCHCPTGYEDPQCQTKSVARYLGQYAGATTCNNGAYLIDSVLITADPNKINYVFVAQKSLLPKVLHGYVSNNEATYSIIVPSDSTTNYLKIYTLTLQGDKVLSISTYLHDQTHPADTLVEKCNFLGSKQ